MDLSDDTKLHMIQLVNKFRLFGGTKKLEEFAVGVLSLNFNVSAWESIGKKKICRPVCSPITTITLAKTNA